MEWSVRGLARALLLFSLSEYGLLISVITIISMSPPFQLTGKGFYDSKCLPCPPCALRLCYTHEQESCGVRSKAHWMHLSWWLCVFNYHKVTLRVGTEGSSFYRVSTSRYCFFFPFSTWRTTPHAFGMRDCLQIDCNMRLKLAHGGKKQ